MDIKGVHHVAFAHEEGGAVVDAISRLLGLEAAHVEHAEGFTERMFATGTCYIQTLEATGPGVVSRFVEKRGAGLHHVAFEVTDIDAAVAELDALGVELVDRAPRPGGMGTRIAFAHPRSFGGLLVELVQTPKRDGS